MSETMDDRTGRIRVAFAHAGGKEDISGVTSWLINLLRSKNFSGKKVDLLVCYPATETDSDYRSASMYNDLCNTHVQMHGCDARVYTEDMIAETIEFLNDTQPEVFLPQCIGGLHFAAQIAGKQGLPWVLTLHADYPEFWGLCESISPNSDEGVWVAVSQHITEKARRLYPHADVRFIPYGAFIPDQPSEFSDEPFKVAYCGRVVEYQKRMSQLIETFILMCQRSPRIQVKIIGDGPARRDAEQAVRDAGMGNRILFCGRVSPDRVQEEIRDCQATVLMSDFEGLPVALLEAMACGVVPVVREIPSGIPELVIPDKTGILTTDSPDEVVNEILKLSEDRALWERLSQGARNHIQKSYSRDKSTRLWNELIHELADRNSCCYPIKQSKRLRLPKVNPDLARVDIRKHDLKRDLRNMTVRTYWRVYWWAHRHLARLR